MTCDRDTFASRSAELARITDSLGKRNERMSFIRLFLFIVMVASFVLITKNRLFAVPGILFFVLFVIVLTIHGKIRYRYRRYQCLCDINNEYISRIDGDIASLKDTGSDLAVSDHDYAGDLDIFGRNSLFNLYNLSDTYMGRRAFADRLLNGHTEDETEEELLRRQDAVKELISRPSFLQEYQATARLGKISSDPSAFRMLAETDIRFPLRLRLIYRLLPLIWLPAIFMTAIGADYNVAVIMITLVINLTVWFFTTAPYSELLSKTGGIARQTKAISDLYVLLENEGFESDLLRSLIGEDNDIAVSDRLRILSGALSMSGFRSQPMLALTLNSLIPYDLICADRLLSWAGRHGKDSVMSLENIGHIEALMSCSCVGIISRESVFPEFTEGAYFEGKDIAHPLIRPDLVVTNSVCLDSSTALITGSNMSGKTTLIRTVGICSLLALTGAPVPASYLKLGRMRIVSSMRIVDSLEGNMSTFKAELVRVARIVEAARDSRPLLFLIDEIFRGTNSTDRTEGALTVLNNLAKPHIIGMMTTHDYALCDKVTETMTNIVYYHFSESYNDTGISFDYKLHNGVSHESNAKYLMKLVGIT